MTILRPMNNYISQFFLQGNSNKKKLLQGLILVIVFVRFVSLNYFNWTIGNTGTPGVQIYFDSDRYTEGALQLLGGKPLDNKQIQYSGYIMVIALLKFFGLGLRAVIILQLIVALISGWFLYDLAKSITKSPWAGIFSVSFYLASPFVTFWHLYILTESLYVSCLMISVWIINKALEKREVKHYALAILTVLIVALIRPNGWIVFPIAFSFFAIYSKINHFIKWGLVMMVVASFLFVAAYIPLVNKSIQTVGSEKTPINEVLYSGEIIWDHPEIRLSMPKDTMLSEVNWTRSFIYIFKHPVSCAKLALYRVSSELFQVFRPWYSFKYQVRVWLWLIPAYIFGAIAIFVYREKRELKLVLAVILSHLLIIALTYADHEHRFLTYFLPLIYLLGGCGLQTIFARAKAGKKT